MVHVSRFTDDFGSQNRSFHLRVFLCVSDLPQIQSVTLHPDVARAITPSQLASLGGAEVGLNGPIRGETLPTFGGVDVEAICISVGSEVVEDSMGKVFFGVVHTVAAAALLGWR